MGFELMQALADNPSAAAKYAAGFMLGVAASLMLAEGATEEHVRDALERALSDWRARKATQQ